MLFHGKTGSENAPECYVIRTLPFLLYITYVYVNFTLTGRTMTQAASHRSVTSESGFDLRRLWTICSGKFELVTDFHKMRRFFPISIILLLLYTYLNVEINAIRKISERSLGIF